MARDWAKYGLYGEEMAGLAPEFLHVEPISSRSGLHEWNISAHSHPGIHQLLLLLRGRGRLVADRSEIILESPVLVAIPSLCIHAFAFAPGSEGWVLSFAVDLIHDPRLALLGQCGIFKDARARQAALDVARPDHGRIVWLLEQFGQGPAEWSTDRLTPTHLAQLALLLASADEVLASHDGAAASRKGEGLAERFRQLVEAHFREGWTLARYARTLATTEQTLGRACHAAFGKPPGVLVQERLVLEAMRHLAYTGDSVKQIADKLGFADPAYFARFFRRHTGQTASTFRREGR